jgi:hypothetical protein
VADFFGFGQVGFAAPERPLRPKAVGDVGRRTNDLDGLAELVGDWMTNPIDIFYRSVWKQEPVLMHKVSAIANCPIDALFERVSVGRVNPFEKSGNGGLGAFWIQLENPKEFRRPQTPFGFNA